MPTGALAYLIAWPGSSEERSIPVFDHLFVGRECSGIDEDHRFLIDDGSVSRTHVELHLDPAHNHAWLTDRSTNGTRLNGTRMERSVPVQIMPGDLVEVGPVEFQFFSRHFTGRAEVDSRQTVRSVDMGELVMTVGDIVSFSTISERTDEAVLLQSINRLYSDLRRLLSAHGGTLSNYVGDAFFATWEARTGPEATAAAAVAFALDAAGRVREIAPSLPLRGPDGEPVHMGFGVGLGVAAVSMMAGAIVTVLGDATNVTFRLSGLASRSGWPDVVVTDAVYALTSERFAYAGPTEVHVKGRTNGVKIYGAAPLGQVVRLGAEGL
ncbi:MAG TPA: adenylate/guanylate cyclase domain-containing protein, partial [Acidimicrobiales bacterium]|nr:adenylate/guanylate cyclase domain-containing protein [Acidimicrobiales bacterium]